MPTAGAFSKMPSLVLRPWVVAPVFGDEEMLFAGVVEQGLEGSSASVGRSRTRAGERGWIKVKEPGVLALPRRAGVSTPSLDRRLPSAATAV